ncbi:MAG: hypothetical protein V1887_01785 [Candidatus Aenigmatarchaeota archaeon]
MVDTTDLQNIGEAHGFKSEESVFVSFYKKGCLVCVAHPTHKLMEIYPIDDSVANSSEYGKLIDTLKKQGYQTTTPHV